MYNLETARIVKILQSYRFSLHTEWQTQTEIEEKLVKHKVDFAREFRYDSKNIVDFMAGGTAIEVKLKGGAATIFKQCERYCEFDETQGLILVTNRSMGFPKELSGKPCYYISLGKAWL